MNKLKKWLPILFIIGIWLAVVFSNQIHYSYPDEFENILGGRFILEGRLPYSGFFTHHNPLAYFVSAVVVLFSGESFVRFRILWGLVLVAGGWFLHRSLAKRFGAWEGKIIAVALVFFTFGATYNWGHMMLADTLGGYLMLAAYAFVFFAAWQNTLLKRKDFWVISLLVSLAVLTTFSLIYAAAVLYGFTFWLYLRKTPRVNIVNFAIIFAAPYIAFLAYLVASGSLGDFYQYSIRYNTDYYIQLPDGVSFRNPFRVAIVYAVKFFESFKVSAFMIKDLNLSYPFISALALCNIAVVIYLLFSRKFALAAFVIAMLVYVNTRGNPYTTAETDYQAFLYHLISILNGIFVVAAMWKDLQATLAFNKKVVFIALLFLQSIFLSALFVHFFDKWQDKTYKKYMGVQAWIYDRPSVAPTLNSLIPETEHYLIGPFDLENQLYMRSQPATKYTMVLPGMDHSPQIQTQLLEEFNRNMPRVVVFDTELAVYGVKPGEFFKSRLNEAYFTLSQLDLACRGIEIKQKWFDHYDFERHFFFDKTKSEELLTTLFDQGLLSPPDPGSAASTAQCQAPADVQMPPMMVR